MTNLQKFYGAAVNNSLLDPFQGFDVEVYAADQATGQFFLTGRFTSIQVTIRNSTEPYLEFNQRSPRYLEGEFQIGFVLERGMIDTRVLAQTYGVSSIRRDLRLNRGPRMQIVFEVSADELHDVSLGSGSITTETFDQGRGVIGNGELLPAVNNVQFNETQARRHGKGRYVLSYCKIDSLTIGATAGRSVVANRWEGLAEDIDYVADTNIWSGTSLDFSATRSADKAISDLQQTNSSGRTIGDPFSGSASNNLGLVNV